MEAPALALTDDDQQKSNEESLSHQIPKDITDRYIDETVYLEVEERLRIREHLPGYPHRSSKQWSKDVRLYTLLRMLGYRDGDRVFQRFEQEQIGDFCLPLTPSVLRQLASVSEFRPSEFTTKQRHVMSNSKLMDEQNLLAPFFDQGYIPGPRARTHRYLEVAKSHFQEGDRIGEGRSAYVLRVQHKLSGKEFACKRLPRKTKIKGQREQMMIFEQEVIVLQRIRHHHIVRLVASFTDLESFSIVLDPVADDVLQMVLKREQPLSDETIAILNCSFNCLATALTYLHENSIRHKGVKPSNILLSSGRVLLCDFGISLEWEESDNGTTEGTSFSYTLRYAAPEVFRWGKPRNLKTDVWSLGCVFLEIFSAIKGYTFEDIDVECVEGQGLPSAVMKTWLEKLRVRQDDATVDLPIDWTLTMILEGPHERLKASDIVSKIHEDTKRHGVTSRFLASCCRQSGYDSPSRTSINSVRTSNLSSYSRAYDSLEAPVHGVSLPQLYRYQSSASQRSDNLSVPTRNTSVASASVQPPTPRTQRSRGDTTNSQHVDIFPSRRTSTTTSRTSSRSESSSFNSPGTPSSKIREIYDVTVCDTSGDPASSRSFSRLCQVRDDEERLFKARIGSFIIADSATVIEFSMCCDKTESTVQVFETAHASMNDHRSSPSFYWKVTRRVVLTNATSPDTRRCYSFWLPLADIRFSLCEATVTLRWSDCNQPQQGSTQDHGEHWSWVYDPVRTNNEATIKFCNIETANTFLDIIRFTVDSSSTINISDSQEVRVWASTRLGRKEGIVRFTHREGSFSDSRMFIIRRCIDPRIEESLSDRRFNVRLNNVSKPNYLSDPVRKPDRGRNRTAQFHRAELIPTSFSLSAPLVSDPESPIPPPAIAAMFKALTGWTLEYFASTEQVMSARHAMQVHKKRYGAADVMLWRKEVHNIVSARITFRLSGEGNVWMSGRISASTSVSSGSRDAICWLDMFGKQRGHLLDMSTMTAITERAPNDTSAMDPALGCHQESRQVTLRIQNYRHRQKLAEVLEELIRSIANNPSAPNANKIPAIRTRYNPLYHQLNDLYTPFLDLYHVLFKQQSIVRYTGKRHDALNLLYCFFCFLLGRLVCIESHSV